MLDLDVHDAAALAALFDAIRDPDRVLAAWQNKELFVTVGKDGIRITLGSVSRDVATVAARYQTASGRPFPSLLRAFLEAHDGINVETTEDAKATVVVDPDPDCTNGLLAARHLETGETADGEHSGLLIGKAYHQCRLLWIDGGDHAGAVVFDDDAPKVVAPSIAAFFHELVAHGLSVEATVEALRD